MKRKLFIIVSLLLVCCLLPMSAMAEWEEGKVVYITSNSPVNVYQQASRNGYLGEAGSKCAYAYLGKSGDWYKIQFTDDVVGYVPAKYSTVKNGYVWENAWGGPGALVLNTNKNALVVRADSHIKSREIGSMPRGAVLEYCGTDSGWYRVEYGGEYGYVAGNRSVVITGSLNGVDIPYEPDAVSGATH